MRRSGGPLLLSLSQLVRCSTPQPCPSSYPLLNFAAAGGVLRLVISSIGSGEDRTTRRKATAPPAGSPGPKGNANTSLPQESRMFGRTGKCNRSPCNFLHEPPPASASSPFPPALGGMKAVEEWRRWAEGRGRCRCVRSNPQGARGGRRAFRPWF